MVLRHSLELCSFQKKLDGLTVHACINDTALAYYLQRFQKALGLQHILCNIDLHIYSQLDLSRGVELTEYLQTIREAFAASQKHWIYSAYIMWCTCPYFCVRIPGHIYRGNKQVFNAEEDEWRNNVPGESEEKCCDKLQFGGCGTVGYGSGNDQWWDGGSSGGMGAPAVG